MARPAGKPTEEPIGRVLARSAKVVGRAFDDALESAGSSRPTWLILMTLMQSPAATQAEIARAVGIREATMSHHLSSLEKDDLVSRTRDPDNRRVVRVSLTPGGRELFLQLAGVAREHDRRLLDGLDDGELVVLRDLLKRLRHNVTP